MPKTRPKPAYRDFSTIGKIVEDVRAIHEEVGAAQRHAHLK